MEENGDVAISIKDLWVSYGDHVVLKKIDLNVHEKDFIGIIGPNGGGKSTLLKAILGLIKPSRGSISIFGRPIREAKRYIGYVPQRKEIPRNFPITVFEVVRLGRYPRKGIGKRFDEDDNKASLQALERVNMLEYRDTEISNLSGGQQQRVFIARALVNDPKLLLLDEPNIGIDLTVQNDFYEMLKRFNERMTIIMISHDVTAISSYVKTVACLNKELHYHGTKAINKEDFEKVYNCPVELIAHGQPHWVLEEH
ncbi:MAG TPA: ABC transporter ATP-binding protein [Candidatus Methanofastidiosa archaeon]|nr:ABC transporter ATP-binding protein [Candidatus Methanofastidiosa archaeon]HPR41932.1 ABC transporter ATP-binding protein [Candidatus Methanofastidiosa archaeon]